jgi:murein L,D-transpeptidase YafK
MQRRQGRVGLAALTSFVIALIAGIPAAFAAGPPLLPEGKRATLVLVEKAERRLSLYRDNQLIETYTVALGGNPVGAKERQGDSRTPEGRYTIDLRNDASRFHLSLRISYPDDADRARAAAAGVSPGGDIFVHGLPNGYGWLEAAHRARDWTDGCIAVTNAEIEEIWSLVAIGTPIEIRP